MAIKERDILLQGQENGQQTIDYPITRLQNIDGTSTVKADIQSTDYIPIVDANGDTSKVSIDTLSKSLLSAKTSEPEAITIPTSGWTSETTGIYTQYIDIAASGVTASSRVGVVLDSASQGVAISCGLSSTAETLDGKIRFRSKSNPTSVLSGEWHFIGTLI
jgi:hypothetical protein